MILVPFFFSSRRRHTRWPRDWSSDVCSSDLIEWIEWAFTQKPGEERSGVSALITLLDQPSHSAAKPPKRHWTTPHVGGAMVRRRTAGASIMLWLLLVLVAGGTGYAVYRW